MKDEPLDQDGDERGSEDESMYDKYMMLKRKMDDNEASWKKEKLELLTRLETVES